MFTHLPGREVVDDGDVVVLCQVRPTAGQEIEHRRCECLCKVRADEAVPAGDDVAYDGIMAARRFSSI